MDTTATTPDTTSRGQPAPASVDDSAQDSEFELTLARATQTVRVRQSRRTFPLMVVGATVFVATYMSEAAIWGLATWITLIMCSTLTRAMVTRHISAELDDAEMPKLEKFERWLLATAMANGIIMGSGFWLVGLNSSDRVVYGLTLVCCIYAIGSMINASVQFRSFAPTVVANLGQGVVFFIGVGVWEPAIAVSLLLILLLQLGFGRSNAQTFADSIRIRSENARLIEQISAEKTAVEQALVAASEANESKNEFLAAASHDLRQPLHALSLHLGSLTLQVKDAKGRELLGRISVTMNVLRNMFDSLLDLAQFNANRVSIENTNFRIDKMLARIHNEFKDDAHNKQLQLSLDAAPLVVHSDANLVERAVRNLLQNAIRYTREGGVSILARTDADKVKVAIIDTGPGIEPEDQARIFDDFVQLHNKARLRHQGVGLGLSIVSRINALLDFSLELESTIGLGTTFEFSLPLETNDLAATRLRQHPQDTQLLQQNLVVWAVEDDPEVSEALKLQLESWHCVAFLATSWADLEAEHARTQRWPDLAMLDDMLGTEETGLDIAYRLRQVMPTDCIVMITGNTLPVRLKEIRESGLQVLLKPTTTSQLHRLLLSVAHHKAHEPQANENQPA